MVKLRSFSAPALVFLIAACSQDSTDPQIDEETPDVRPTASLTITPDTATLTVGDSLRLSVRVVDLPNSSATFASSNPTVAIVTDNGTVLAESPGTAMIIATSTSNPGAVDAALVTVKPRVPRSTHIEEMPALGLGTVDVYETAEVAIAGNYAYTTTCCTRPPQANIFYVWDISGNKPLKVDSVRVGDVSYVGDAHVSDDEKLLLISMDFGPEEGVAVYDISNPRRPVFLSRWIGTENRGTHTAKWGRVNGKLYIFTAHIPFVTILDASDPRNLRVIGAIRPGVPYTHDVFVRDGLLFTADWDAGMTIWDVGGGNRGGSPSNPVKISNIRTVGGSAHNIWWMHDSGTGSKRYVFVGEENIGVYPVRTTGDVHVVDISDINNPREVAFFHVDAGSTSNLETAGPHNFWADEERGYLYAAFYNGGIRVIDTRGDLSDCESWQKSRDGRCDLRLMGREAGRGLVDQGLVGIWGVVYRNGKVYASDMLNGLWVVDASRLNRHGHD